MKTIYTILFGTCLLLIACKNEQVSTTIGVAGTIENPRAPMVKLSKGGFEQTAQLDSTGSFSIIFEGEPGYYDFNHGRESTVMYLQGGDQLNLQLNTQQFDETLSYEGEGAGRNNYLAAKYLAMEKLQPSAREDYSLNEEEFVAKMDSYESDISAMLDTTQLSSTFKTYEKKNIKYEFLRKRKNYEAFHQYYAGKSDFKASESYNKQFEGIDVTNEEDFAMVPSYRDFVTLHYLDGEMDEAVAKLKETESTVIKNKVVKDLVSYLSPGIEDLGSVVSDLSNLTTDSTVVQTIQNKYAQMKNLTRGNPSPEFRLENIEGDIVSLEDLRGKNLYVDVWATWCGPCKREIPYLKELEAEYHDQNVEFVSISVDERKDFEKWQNMVAEKELKGIQLISENGWNTDFVRRYMIRGIPRFILIDADGVIYNADAPRPSSGEKIRSILNEMTTT